MIKLTPDPEQDFSEAVLDPLPPVPPGDVFEGGDVLAWYQNDQLHRDDAPAIIYPDGGEAWYQHGQLHRDDGPAVTDSEGGEFWYSHDQLHRDDGPAVYEADGTRVFYQHGKLHRDGGPAVSGPAVSAQWYLDGHRVHRFSSAGRAVRRESAQNIMVAYERALDQISNEDIFEAPDI